MIEKNDDKNKSLDIARGKREEGCPLCQISEETIAKLKAGAKEENRKKDKLVKN